MKEVQPMEDEDADWIEPDFEVIEVAYEVSAYAGAQ